jgi:thioredoxin reductase (NADPH)
LNHETPNQSKHGLGQAIEQLDKNKQNQVAAVELDKPHNDSKILTTDGVFIEIGSVPGTALIESLGLKIDETGHAVVADNMETNIPGLFCAGDMTSLSKTFKQATWAAGQGARASASAFKYLKKQFAPQIRGI